jgi:hypothetical protein
MFNRHKDESAVMDAFEETISKALNPVIASVIKHHFKAEIHAGYDREESSIKKLRDGQSEAVMNYFIETAGISRNWLNEKKNQKSEAVFDASDASRMGHMLGRMSAIIEFGFTRFQFDTAQRKRIIEAAQDMRKSLVEIENLLKEKTKNQFKFRFDALKKRYYKIADGAEKEQAKLIREVADLVCR